MARFVGMVALVCLSFILIGCGGAETVVEATQYEKATAEFPAGQICVDSNVSAAPFIIRDRDLIIEVASVTYACFVLQVGEYQVEFLEVKTFSKTPPRVDNLELKSGLRFDVTGTYVQ